MLNALSVMPMLTLLEIVRLGVVVMGIGFTDMTLSEMPFFSAAQSAAFAPRRELPSLIPVSHSRLADVFLPSWKGGRPAALYVTVISTLQQLTAATEERKLSAHAQGHSWQGNQWI